MATRKKPNAETEAYEALTRALARIAELERKVALLEAQPREQHTHYHTAPYVAPVQTPAYPGWTTPIICGNTDGSAPVVATAGISEPFALPEGTVAGWNG